MLNFDLKTNGTEKTIVYTDKNGLRTNLSKLVSAGDDPECLCIAKYNNDEQYDPVEEMKFYGEEEKELLRKWLNL